MQCVFFTILCNLENAQGRSDGKYDEKGSADDGNCLLRNVLGNVSSILLDSFMGK